MAAISHHIKLTTPVAATWIAVSIEVAGLGLAGSVGVGRRACLWLYG